MAEPATKKARIMSTSTQLTSPSTIRHQASHSPSKIRVRNLQATLTGPADAWGRTGRPQPALITVEVWLKEPFKESSAKDEVAGDTVHYGLLSKAVMATLKKLEARGKGGEGLSLYECVGSIWGDMVGGEDGVKGFLNTQVISYLGIEICLTKASLVGDGVVSSWCGSFQEGRMAGFAPTFGVRGLRIPTLIGVNSNERTGKQILIAGLEIEGKDTSADQYCEIEALVTKIIEESFYETLEALALDVLKQLKRQKENWWASESPWTMRLALEKPIAVPFADAACVELSMRTDK